MKGRFKRCLAALTIILMVIAIIIMSGCEKPPQQEINDIKAHIKGIETQEGGIYAAEELRLLKEDLDMALDEVKTQDEKMFIRRYERSKEMLAKVKADAENLAIAVPKRREQVRNTALAAQEEAKTMIEETKVLLGMAPTGKGTQADIEAFKADLKGLEDSLGEIQQAIDAGKYFAAIDSAKVIREKTDSIAQQIRLALEKVRVRT